MKTILVAEDDKIVRNNVEFILTHNNFNVVTAANGEDALSKVKELLPDLIISDIMMPVMDGYDLFLNVKKDKLMSSIPFIFLTSKSKYEDLREGMNLGADDYLVKPFYVKELMAAVNSVLSKSAKVEKRLDDLRNSIALTVPHEFRTPLMAIMGFSEIMKSELEFAPVSDEIRSMVDSISSSAKRFHNLIKKFTLYTESVLLLNDKNFIQKLRQHTVLSPEMIIRESAANISADFKRSNDIEVEVEDVEIYSDQYILTYMIEELLINAFKYSEPGNKVTVSSNIDDSVYSISIRNEGKEMSAEQIKDINLFNQFSDDDKRGAGNGVGLITARRLAEVLNIGFNIQSSPGEFIEIKLSINIVNNCNLKGNKYEMVL